MAMKKGYKQTEIGVIPKDWETRKLVDCVRSDSPICYGILMPGEHIQNGVPVIKVRDITDGRIAEDQLLLTHPKIDAAYSRSRLLAGDLLITIRGTTGRVAIVPSSLSNSNITQDTARIRTKTNARVSFLFFILQCPTVQKQIALHTVGQAVKGINIRDVKRIEFPLPPTLTEQEAIAGALSDADAWIESLEQLIAKKRRIKQGAMQELLTGKRRLPGFSGKWETKRLGDHCQFLRNGTNSRAELTVEGSLKYLHYGDIHSCNGVYICPKSLPSLPTPKANTLDRLQDGDLVLADASEDTIGISRSVEIVDTDGFELVAGLHTIAVRFSEGIFAPRFAGYLQHCPDFNSHLRKLAAGTKVYATNRRHVSSAEVIIPRINEQTAIATVLSDMDTEIESLELKLAKAREVKQGMMQELLTGRIRLV